MERTIVDGNQLEIDKGGDICTLAQAIWADRSESNTITVAAIGSERNEEGSMRKYLLTGLLILFVAAMAGCTQETQNKIGRSIQNWTGTDGVLEVYAGEKLVRRFIHIDKLSTASATSDGKNSRPYRFGYGFMDENFNMKKDPGEKKVYFEFSDFSTSYIFFENPV